MRSTTVTCLFTSNASLVRCELDRVKNLVNLQGDYAAVGNWSDGQLVERYFGAGTSHERLWEIEDSDIVLMASGTLKVGRNLEKHGQPLRFHQWLFGQVGGVPQPDEVRDKIESELPAFIRRTVQSETLAEAAFGVFLNELRRAGQMDDEKIESIQVARALVAASQTLERAALEVGDTTKGHFALLAANGRVFAAARRGEQHLGYLLLEGQPTCERCGLRPETGQNDPRVRDHLRRRSVLVSTNKLSEHDVEVPNGSALAISSNGRTASGPQIRVLSAKELALPHA